MPNIITKKTTYFEGERVKVEGSPYTRKENRKNVITAQTENDEKIEKALRDHEKNHGSLNELGLNQRELKWRFGMEQPNHASRLELATREIGLRNKKNKEINGKMLLKIMGRHDDDFSKDAARARKHLRNRVITPLMELGILETPKKSIGPEGILNTLRISSYYLKQEE
ncbi:hypothetical protein HY993_03475 [Candidatus Micrarchaeota archaeon]|nr:hypothetical protein [Candidatus Micrarchaeota archaeon]